MPPLHPACAAWPPLSAAELQALADDIRENGLLEPVVLIDGAILDGRHRWLACELASVEPRTVIYQGDDPIGYVLSRNLHHRHMTLNARALAVATLDRLPRGRPANVASGDISSRKQLAALGGITLAALARARALLDHAEPNILDYVRSGAVTLSAARRAIRGVSREAQRAMAAADVKPAPRRAPASPAERAAWAKERATLERRIAHLTEQAANAAAAADRAASLAAGRGVLTAAEFRKIMACLGPEHCTSRYAGVAHRIFSGLDRVLVRSEAILDEPS